MFTTRFNAILVGVLFLVGTLTGILTAVLANPILQAPDYLAQMAGKEMLFGLATSLYFLMAVSCAGIGLALFPILRRYSEGLALGVAGFRLLEGMIQVAGAAGMAVLFGLSRIQAETTALQVAGATVKLAADWLGNGPMLLCWCIAAWIYYSLFYQHRLVPRWLSIWGLAGIGLTTIASILVMLNLLPSFGSIQTAANMPIMIQELVFAGWLIIKGVQLKDARGDILGTVPGAKGIALPQA